MATPAERINDLDLHLNPPITQPQQLTGNLDILRKQASEPASGMHDFSGIKKPTENLVLDDVPDNDPLKGWGEPTFGDDVIHVIDRGAAVNGNEKSSEPIFEPSRELVAYIKGLTDVPKKTMLFHDLDGSSLESFKKNIDKLYNKGYLKEDEYNRLISLIEDKPEVEIQPMQAEPLMPVVAEAENPVSSAEPVTTHDSSEETRVEGDADLVLEGEVLRFLGVYDYEEARLRIEQIKNEEKKKDLLTLMESLKETTNRVPTVPKSGETVSVVGQDAPIIEDDIQETDHADSTGEDKGPSDKLEEQKEIVPKNDDPGSELKRFDSIAVREKGNAGVEVRAFEDQKKELISYLRSLFKLGVGPEMTLQVLESEDLSREEVLVVLHDAYYVLGTLSQGEYKKSLGILGEPHDLAMVEPRNLPSSNPESLARTRDGDISSALVKTKSDEPGVVQSEVATDLRLNATVDSGDEDGLILHSISDTDKADSEKEVAADPVSQEVVAVVVPDLDVARENYAQAKIEFSKKNSSYNKIKKSLLGLLSGGILSGRSSEKSPTEVELEEAQKNLDNSLSSYIETKKAKRDEIIYSFKAEIEKRELEGTLTPEEKAKITGQIKIKLLEQAEKEWDLLQEQVSGLSSKGNEKIQKIKEMTAEGLKVWSKVPMAARLAVAPILIGTGVGLTAGLGAGALYAGTRLGRGLGGAVGSRIAGSLYGRRADRINAEAHEETVSSYTDENSGKSFEEREAAYMRAREEEAKRKNSQRIKKAMVMVGAGAGAGILTGLAESSAEGLLSSKPSMASLNEVSKPKVPVRSNSFVDGIRPKADVQGRVEITPKPGSGAWDSRIPGSEHIGVMEQPQVIHAGNTRGLDNTVEITPKPGSGAWDSRIPGSAEHVGVPNQQEGAFVKVELSSKGSLQDIHNLKASIIKQYGDKIPSELKTNIIDKPSVDIARQYGFYDPNNPEASSALTQAGGKLGVDSHGHLVYENGGKSEVMFDSKTGNIKTFKDIGGKMFTPKIEVPEGSDVPATPVTMEKLSDVPMDQVIPDHNAAWDSRMAVEHVAVPDEPEIVQDVDTPENVGNHTAYGVSEPGKVNIGLDVIDKAGSKAVVLDGVEIAHEEPFGTGKILALDKKFQEGVQYKGIRESFAQAFEKSVTVDQVGQSPTRLDFEGGRIYIIQGLKDDPMGMKVLLNGKEIASGSMEVKGSVLGPKLKFDNSLKGGWFLDDNAYERAFKNVKKFLQIK